MVKHWQHIVLLAAALLVASTHANLEQSLDTQLDKVHISSKNWKLPVVNVPTKTLELTHAQLEQYAVSPGGAAIPEATGLQSLSEVEAGHDVNPGDNVGDTQPGNTRQLLTSSRPHIKYKGGAVMVNTPNVYMIYVNSQPSSGTADWTWTHWPNFMLANLGGSYRYNINARYYNKQKQHVNGKLHLAAAVRVNVPAHFKLDARDGSGSLGGLGAVLHAVMNSGKLPVDTDNGIYMVAVAPDSGLILDSSFCKTYCGFHGEYGMTLNNNRLQFRIAFVPMAGVKSCAHGCNPDPLLYKHHGAVSPTGSPYMDGFLSILLHELEETVTDPQPGTSPAWQVRVGNNVIENGDLCVWQLGTFYSTDVKGKTVIYNAVVGGVPVLVQMGWDINTEQCVQGVVGP